MSTNYKYIFVEFPIDIDVKDFEGDKLYYSEDLCIFLFAGVSSG